MRKTIHLLLFLIFCIQTLESQAAVVHLIGGESLSGQIESMDEQVLLLESDRGFGLLEIDKADIRFIEFEGSRRDLSRKFGIGYYRQGVIAGEYTANSASLKHWLSSTGAFDLLFGYGRTADKTIILKSIFNLELRLTQVLLQEGNNDLYWGGGLGFIRVTDRATQTAEDGLNLRMFLGVEFFFSNLPNVGISAELGVGGQLIGDRATLGIFSTGFPTMAVRYYF